MRLSDGVRIDRNDGRLFLCAEEANCPVRDEDRYILELLEAGEIDDKTLIERVERQEQVCSVTAELRLAQVVLDYGDYIAPASARRVIEA